jgi:hypothetical protein
MATYWISFRIDERTIQGRGYQERYDALHEAVLSSAPRYWKETTSFIAFESTDSIDGIAQACKGAIAPSYDLFLIRTMDSKDARICGQNADRDIYVLMPYLQAI